MPIPLKPLDQQVIVVTGASSGIGLTTAELAAERGASVVFAARSRDTIDEAARRMSALGRSALAVACDVSDQYQVNELAQAAINQFGRIDTWVNAAGIGFYGRIEDTDLRQARQLFEVNLWGTIYGSLAALPHLRLQGGALINVGSEVSEAPTPLLGYYVASKHAVKGFTDSLRIELQQLDDAHISVTLIEPTATDTPFPQHAGNAMNHEPRLPDPLIEPVTVAEAILDAAVRPVRVRRVGLMSHVNTTLSRFTPALAEFLAGRRVHQLSYKEPPRNPTGILFQPSETAGPAGQVHGTGGREH